MSVEVRRFLSDGSELIVRTEGRHVRVYVGVRPVEDGDVPELSAEDCVDVAAALLRAALTDREWRAVAAVLNLTGVEVEREQGMMADAGGEAHAEAYERFLAAGDLEAC